MTEHGRLPIIALPTFLKELFGASCWNTLQDDPRLRRMFVRLLCFRDASAVNFSGKVHAMFNRAGGIACKHSPGYCDLIIPLLVISEDDKLEDVIVTRDRMSVLIIKVKSQSWEDKTMDKLPTRDQATKDFECDLLNPNLDYVSLTMHFSRETIAKVKMVEGGDPRPIGIAAFGLRPSLIENNGSFPEP